MIGYNPTVPGGPDLDVVWKRSVEERLRALRVVESAGMAVQRTGRGIVLTPTAVSVGKGSPPSIPVSMFRVKEVSREFIICKTWDGEEDGEDDVLIAKPFKLRNSNTSADIGLTRITYVYNETNPQQRTASTNVDSEIQIVIPRFLLNDVIYATVCKGNNSGVKNVDVPIKWLDINADGRAWARKFQQLPETSPI